MTDFVELSRDCDVKQREWIEFSTKLNEDFLKAKAENSQLKKQAQKLGLLNEDGYTKSELAKDL
jgi:hypothetical protein